MLEEGQFRESEVDNYQLPGTENDLPLGMHNVHFALVFEGYTRCVDFTA